MANRAKDKKEIDPEELMKRKFRAKCLFRALGRLVMENAYWLIEAIDDYAGDDVKRRVEQAVRSKTRKKQLLNINDKALLNKPAEERTDHEKKYIYRIIGGLKCFKRYPNVSHQHFSHSSSKIGQQVKKKLAAVTYFKYYGPGRVIVRQHHEAHALYFIVTGKVTVSQMVFDELLQKEVSLDIGVMYPGDMFGEVSLLHNIPRTATVTTNEHCEFLQLLSQDFKNVLQASVQKQWDEVRRAMSMFTYFDSLDERSRREGCIVAKLKSYDINDILLGDGQAVANYVYFILSGHCQMIESLQIYATVAAGHTYYMLHDPYVPPDESEQDLDKKYFDAYKNLSRKTTSSVLAAPPLQEASTHAPRKSKVEIQEDSNIVHAALSRHHVTNKRSSLAKHHSNIYTNSATKRQSSVHIIESADDKEMRRRSSLANRQSTSAMDSRQSASKDIMVPSLQDQPRASTRFSVIPEEVILKPPNLQTYYMQVCQLNPGASFGFGENMRDRRIVALTPVYCMLIPKVWLLQRNTANIWTRIEHYLEKKIPNKKHLFKEFVAQRRWEEYRDVLVEDVVAHSKTVNYTSVHDVPYSIRIEEMLDI